MSESPPDRPLIHCPGCDKDVWPHNEMTVSGGFQDKCPTSGCGTNLSHLMTDAHRAGHATTKPIRTSPVEPEPPLTASGVAAALAEALKAAGLIPQPGPLEGPGVPFTTPNATGVAPHPGNVYPHPAPTNWEPAGGGGLGPSSPPPLSMAADIVPRMLEARIRANTAIERALASERAALTAVLGDLEARQ